MKINVDLRELWGQVNRVTEDRIPWEPDLTFVVPEVILKLHEGIEVALEDVTLDGGLLSYEGAQVLLYIPDQGRNFAEVVVDPESGRRFHLAHCQTLEGMRQKGRFDRYVVTNRLDGVFKISGLDPNTQVARDGTAELKVCINCLKHLNFEDYLGTSRARQKAVWHGFSIAAFFEKFSTHFRHLPNDVLQGRNASAYTDDWRQISDALRQQRGWRCEACRVELSAHRALMHVHHINGVRADNRPQNLKVLCKDCHRKEPGHDTMFIRSEEMATIQRERRNQGVIATDWATAMRLADSAIEGALQLAQSRGFLAPIVSYELRWRNGSAMCEVAWPDRNIALVVGPSFDVPNWQIFRAVDFIQRFGA